jgi:DNA transposition AAA+ family ATPase
MRATIVNTEPRMLFLAALAGMPERGPAVPAIMLVEGKSGSGKTTALASAVVASKAIFVRAEAMGSAASLLDDLCWELGIEAPYRNSAKYKAIVEKLKSKPRPLIVDEVDYLLKDPRQLEMLRDIHDACGIPVVLVGMEGINRKLLRFPQFTRRISHRLHFGPVGIEDAELLAAELCEVEIEPALLARMHKEAEGNIGLMVVAMSRFEKHAKGYGLAKMTLEKWGQQSMFLSNGKLRNGIDERKHHGRAIDPAKAVNQ